MSEFTLEELVFFKEIINQLKVKLLMDNSVTGAQALIKLIGIKLQKMCEKYDYAPIPNTHDFKVGDIIHRFNILPTNPIKKNCVIGIYPEGIGLENEIGYFHPGFLYSTEKEALENLIRKLTLRARYLIY